MLFFTLDDEPEDIALERSTAEVSPENPRTPRLERQSQTLTNFTARIAVVDFGCAGPCRLLACRCSPQPSEMLCGGLSTVTQLSKRLPAKKAGGIVRLSVGLTDSYVYFCRILPHLQQRSPDSTRGDP